MSSNDLTAIFQNKIPTIKSSDFSLRTGQMVSGKVIKLFSDNLAQVRLGKQLVTARLQAPLELGKNYIFSVQSINQVPTLKMLYDITSKETDKINIEALLVNFGLKPSKTNISLFETISKENIPFTKQTLNQAARLLTSVEHKEEAKSILLQMLKRNLPMRPSIFHALYTAQSGKNGLSDLSKDILSTLENTPILSQRMKDLLSLYTSNPNQKELSKSVIKQLVFESLTGNQTSFHVFKKAMIVPQNQSYKDWQQTWTSWAINNNVIDKNVSSLNQNIKQFKDELDRTITSKLVKDQPLNKWLAKLSILWDEQLPISKLEIQNLSKLGSALQRIRNIPSKDSSQFEQKILSYINDLQSSGTISKLNKVFPEGIDFSEKFIRENLEIKNYKPLQKIALFLKDVLEMQLSQKEQTVLTKWLFEQSTNAQALNSSTDFLIRLKAFFQLSGFQHESNLADQQPNPVDSIKTVLLQLLQGSTQDMEKTKQLLQHLHGMQLSLQHHQDQVIQMNLQIPGELFHLKQDIKMELTGKQKEKSKEINPDYCQVLFYLNLDHLKETIISMNIQKRIVHINLYNNNQEYLQKIVALLEPQLREGLSRLNYQLSKTQVKPFTKLNKRESIVLKQEQGVDYRI